METLFYSLAIIQILLGAYLWFRGRGEATAPAKPIRSAPVAAGRS